MVPSRGLPPGLLVGRGTTQSLLSRGDSAQAAEAPQELPGADEKRQRRGLGGGAPQAVVDRGAQTVVGHGRDGDSLFWRSIGAMKQVEQACSRFDKIARRAEAIVAWNPAKADHELFRRSVRGVESQRLGRSVVAGHLTRCFDFCAGI